jgi:hypothetical protein
MCHPLASPRTGEIRSGGKGNPVHNQMEAAATRPAPTVSNIGAVKLVLENPARDTVWCQRNVVNGILGQAQDALQRRIKIVVDPAEIRLLRIALFLELLDNEVDHWVGFSSTRQDAHPEQ